MTDRPPKTSVVIPCYNYAHYLPDAVGSVAAQTRADIEVVIVNDGSTDDTVRVAEGLIARYPALRIRLVDQENRGLPTARNNGIAAAAGEYILPLDADDMLAPEYVEKTAGLLDARPDLSIAYTFFTVFGEVPDSDKALCYGQDYFFEQLLIRNIIPVTSMFRKAAWEETGGYKKEMSGGYEDWEFWITLGEAGHYGMLIREPLFLYRRHGTSMIDGSTREHAKLYTRIRSLHPGIYTKERLDDILMVIDGLVVAKDMLISELMNTVERQQRFIDDMHSIGGIARRAYRAALRRLGVDAG